MSLLSFKSIDLKNIQGVILDLDNTLYEYEPCHKRALFNVFNAFSGIFPCTYDEFTCLYKEAQDSVKSRTSNQAASHSRLLYFQHMIEKCSGKTLFEKTLVFEGLYWETFIDAMEIDPAAAQFLVDCKKNSIKVCIITDLTSEIQFKKILKLGIEDKVSFMVTSEEAGVEKPDPRIFEYTLNKIKLTKSEVIVIGDNKIKDIDGAEKLGIKAYLVRG